MLAETVHRRLPTCLQGLRAATAVPALALALLTACGGGYHHYAGPLRPIDDQDPAMTIADDGGVTYVQGRLEVRMRPLTDEELNRQFASLSNSGPRSTNPYTFGDHQFYEGQETRQPFSRSHP